VCVGVLMHTCMRVHRHACSEMHVRLYLFWCQGIHEEWYAALAQLETDPTKWPVMVPSLTKCHATQQFCRSTGNKLCSLLPCAVCGENQQGSSTKTIAAAQFLQSYHEFLKPWPEVDELFEDNPVLLDYGEPLLNGKVLLEPLGVECTEESGTNVHVCKRCYQFLERGKTPPRSLANGRWNGIGFLPKELADLTVAERVLCGLTRSRIHLVRLGFAHVTDKVKKYALHGHVISFPQDPGPAVRALPRPVSELTDTIRIVFVGSELPSHKVIERYTLVRRSKVLAAIRWLKRFNHMWRDVEIDVDALNALPEHGVPQEIHPTSVSSKELAQLIAADRSGYAKGQCQSWGATGYAQSV
jgi:hypothetical protein